MKEYEFDPTEIASSHLKYHNCLYAYSSSHVSFKKWIFIRVFAISLYFPHLFLNLNVLDGISSGKSSRIYLPFKFICAKHTHSLKLVENECCDVSNVSEADSLIFFSSVKQLDSCPDFNDTDTIFQHHFLCVFFCVLQSLGNSIAQNLA